MDSRGIAQFRVTRLAGLDHLISESGYIVQFADRKCIYIPVDTNASESKSYAHKMVNARGDRLDNQCRASSRDLESMIPKRVAFHFLLLCPLQVADSAGRCNELAKAFRQCFVV